MMKKFVIVKSNRKYTKLFIDEILFCKASGAYTEFYCVNKEEAILSSLLLKKVEQTLADTSFFRINRSYLVNLEHCHELVRATHEIILSDKKRLSISRSRMKGFIRTFCAYS